MTPSKQVTRPVPTGPKRIKDRTETHLVQGCADQTLANVTYWVAKSEQNRWTPQVVKRLVNSASAAPRSKARVRTHQAVLKRTEVVHEHGIAKLRIRDRDHLDLIAVHPVRSTPLKFPLLVRPVLIGFLQASLNQLLLILSLLTKFRGL